MAAAVARELGGAAWRAHGDRQRGLSGEAGDIYPRDCVFATGEYLELCKSNSVVGTAALFYVICRSTITNSGKSETAEGSIFGRGIFRYVCVCFV